MARILISYFSDYGEAMYDAITQELLKNGNSIFRLNINNSNISITGWGGESNVNNKQLYQDIVNFNPEIILNFNHSLPSNLVSVFNHNCKICIIDADNPETFWNKKLYKTNSYNYVYLGLQSYSKTMYEKSIGYKLTEGKNYLYFPPATIIKHIKIPQDKNISFIGSNFFPIHIPEGVDFYREIAFSCYDKFKKDYFFSREDAYKIFGNVSGPNWLYDNIRSYYVGQDRLKTLQSITDLGLKLYGIRWNKIAFYDFELAKSYDKQPIISIEDNQRIYNSSKISLNISHPQARSSFSWRVMDIMASQACLLMEDKQDWRDLFAPYLSPKTLENVIYQDRFDMREKAKKLLSDDKLRTECVFELNHAIEKNGRWKHRFRILECFLKVQLLNLKNKSPQYIFVSKDNNQGNERQRSNNFTNLNTKLNTISNIKRSAKLSFYLLYFLLAQFPILNLLVNSQEQKKILKKIYKYSNKIK